MPLNFVVQPFVSRAQAGEARVQARYQRAMSRYYARVAAIKRQNAETERQAARGRAEQETRDRSQEAGVEARQARRRRALLEAVQSTAGVVGTSGSASLVSADQAGADAEGMMVRDQASEQRRRILLWEGEAAATAGRNAALQTEFQGRAAAADAKNLRAQARALTRASNLGFLSIGLAALAPVAAPLAGAAGIGAGAAGALATGARGASIAASGMASYYQATSGRPGASHGANDANEAASLLAGAWRKPRVPGAGTIPGPAAEAGVGAANTTGAPGQIGIP